MIKHISKQTLLVSSYWGYIIPNDYELSMENNDCLTGKKGSHGGCPTCIMSKIKLASKSQQRIDNPSLQTIIPSDYILLKSISFNFSTTEFINVYASTCTEKYLE